MAVDFGLIPASEPIKTQSHVLALKGQPDWDKSALSIFDISGKEAFDAGWITRALLKPLDELDRVKRVSKKSNPVENENVFSGITAS